jgi:hypothetical protein
VAALYVLQLLCALLVWLAPCKEAALVPLVIIKHSVSGGVSMDVVTRHVGVALLSLLQ